MPEERVPYPIAQAHFDRSAARVRALEALASIDDDEMDIAIAEVCMAVDDLVAITPPTLLEFSHKFEAVAEHGDWRTHAPLLRRDLKRLVAAAGFEPATFRL